MRCALIAVLLFAACAREQHATPTATQETLTSNAEVGDPMPPYKIALLDGKTFDTKSEKGNVVLLNVWATWCAPCRFEIPELQSLQEKYSSRGFNVVGVSTDDTGVAGVQQFVKENKMTYPIAVDADGHIANVLRTTALPTTVIIDRDGKIVFRKLGPIMPNEKASVEALIDGALAKKR